jgi:hypothetical protein
MKTEVTMKRELFGMPIAQKSKEVSSSFNTKGLIIKSSAPTLINSRERMGILYKDKG